MPKPIANAKPFTGELIGEYLLTLQKGTATDAAGLDQMTKLKLNVLRDYILQGVAPALHPVSQSGSTLPENPANGDYFFADTTFTVSGKTYTQGHMYTWDGTEWKDTSGIFSQYATQAQVDDLQLKVDALDGLNFKGSITEAQLEQITPSSENKGWMYYVSDLGVYKASDGTNWVTVIDYVTQTIESGNTTEAPSSDAVYKMKTQLEEQIANNSQRLTNVEQAVLGKDLQIDTDDTQANVKTIIKANLLPYAILKRVGSRSVPWNQLSDIDSYSTTDGTYIKVEHIGHTVKLTVRAVPSSTIYTLSAPYMEHNNLNPTHKYLLLGKQVTTGSNSVVVTRRYTRADSTQDYGSFSEGIVTGLAAINLYSNVTTSAVAGDTCSFADGQIFDLTAMGEYDSNKTDAENIASFKAKYPASYYPATTGQMIDVPPTSFKVVGKNIWNQLWEIGDIKSDTGADSGSDHAIRCVGYIPVEPSKTYYFFVSSAYALKMRYYDVDKNYIGYADANGASNAFNNARVMPSNCHYIRFAIDNTTSYNKTVQICDNTLSAEEKTTFEDYHEQIVDTSFMAGTKYINPSCHDYSENVYEGGILKRKEHIVVGQVDLGTLIWGYAAGSWAGSYFQAFIPLAKFEGAGIVAKALCSDGYVVISRSQMANHTNMVFCFDSNGQTLIQLKNSSKGSSDIDAQGHASWLEGVKLYYELATPTTSLHNDPIPNLEVEDGTTVWAITPQTELVNAIDVPSTIYIESKITA